MNQNQSLLLKYINICGVLLCALILTACSHNSNGKLSSSFKPGTTFDSKMVVAAQEKPVSVIVPQVHVTNAGLLGALYSGISNSVSLQKRSAAIQEVATIVNEKEINALNKALEDVVINAPWLKIKDVARLRQYPVTDRDNIAKSYRASNEYPYIVSLITAYNLSEDFKVLMQNSTLQVFKNDNGAQGDRIYQLALTTAFSPSEQELAAHGEGQEAHYIWTKNNAAMIKKGTRVTMSDMVALFKENMANPYSVDQDKSSDNGNGGQ